MAGKASNLSFESNLQNWIVNESNFILEGHLYGVPDLNTIQKLARGNLREFFVHITEHCRSRRNVKKIREILAAKRDLENDYSPSVYEHPEDIDAIQLEISKAIEQREFLGNSVSTLESTLISVESEIQTIRKEMNRINQKTALFELLHDKIRCDINFVSSFHEKLTLLLYKIEQISRASSKPSDDNFKYKVNFFLNELSTMITKQLDGELTVNMKNEFCKKVKDQLSSVPFTHVLECLIDICKNSQSQIVQSISKEVVKSSDIQTKTSTKYLRELKEDFVKKNFRIQSLKKELVSAKTVNISKKAAFEEKLLLSQSPIEVFERLELLDDMLKLEKVKKSTQFYQKSLHDIKNDTSNIISKNEQMSLTLPDVSIRQDRFMRDFNILKTLQTTSPVVHSNILKFAGSLQTLVREGTFKDLALMKDYLEQIEDSYKVEIGTVFDVLDTKQILDIILKPPFLEDNITKSIKDSSEVLKFQNVNLIAHSLIYLKKEAAKSINLDNFILHEDSSDINTTHENVLINSNQIDTSTQEAQFLMSKAVQQMKSLQVVTRDWKEQGAQFIPDIVFAGRSLKMWLDVLTLLPEIHF